MRPLDYDLLEAQYCAYVLYNSNCSLFWGPGVLDWHRSGDYMNDSLWMIPTWECFEETSK